MLILERSVTKHYQIQMYRKLYRAIQQERYSKVGTAGVLLVTFGTRHRYYVITVKDEGKLRPIAWLYLWQKKGWEAWEVMQVFVFEKLRGKGLAKKLYSAAINLDSLIMTSGKTQSKHSRALWSSFIRNNSYFVFAIDYWNLKDRSQVLWVDDEIWCQLDIYFVGDLEHQDRDVRLIATRKENDNSISRRS